ncbi:MAG: DUF2917 domain-containing protein [Burkholderiales bacterium]|nr:DUF2917 domain-containing protein [Burkholderiales bacterium]MBH2015424.1 DUF2917 domain-containing protein [Burkholderiales bacterium]
MFNWIRGRGPTHPRPLPRGPVDQPVELPAGSVHRLRLRAGDALLVRRGRVWMTRSGDLRDHLLTPGQGHVAPRSEDVVLESVAQGGSVYECQASLRTGNVSRVLGRLWSSRLPAANR